MRECFGSPGEKRPRRCADVWTGVTRESAGLLICCWRQVSLALSPLTGGLRLAAGMKCNSDCYPEVSDPGDEAVVYFPQESRVSRGLWNGTSRVTLLNADENRVCLRATATIRTSTTRTPGLARSSPSCRRKKQSPKGFGRRST